MSDFHLLRPEALLLLIPLIGLLFIGQRKKQLTGEWQKLIHPKLQAYVMQQPAPTGAASHWFVSTPLWVMAFLAVLALTGPTWQKQDSPVFNSRAGLVIALDLSLSMTAQDISPSRLQRAKYKIIDAFEQAQTPAIALLAYAGDTHVAAPLTRDTATIESLLPSLNPYMMPLHGSHLVRLAEQSAKLFDQAESQPRQLLLITDGVEKQDIDAAAAIFKEHQIDLSILAVGTEQGAPLVKPDGSFFSDAQGNVIMPGLEIDNLKALQRATGAKLTTLSNDDSDIEYLLNRTLPMEGFEQSEDSLTFDQWHDAGYWLVALMIPFALFAFRKGVLSVLLLTSLFSVSDDTLANTPTKTTAEEKREKQAATHSEDDSRFDWRDWFRNGDQQGMARFDSNPEAAAQRFNDPKWQASSAFKAGQYEQAAKKWAEFDDSDSHYNRGNALAKMNKLDEAIAAYDHALKQQPDHESAAYNKALLEQLKNQQQQQQGGDQNQQDGESQEQQNGQQQDGQQQNGQSANQSSENASNQSEASPRDDNPSTDPSQTQGDADNQTEQDKLAQQDAESSQADEEQNAQQSETAQQQDGDNENTDGLAQSQAQTQQDIEQQQALQQWLQRIPDNPGGLLENKFRHQYSQRQYENNNEDRKPW